MDSGAASDLDEIAAGLYVRPPEGFVAERAAHVAQARERGDRELARAVQSLRKPTRAAWLANLLASRRAAELDALLGLGEQLREAQQALQGEDLRRLLDQRRAVVTRLVRTARRLAAEAGSPVAEDTGWDLEAALETALADPEAAEAVRSGRLVSTTDLTVSEPAPAATGLSVRAGAGSGRAGSTARPSGRRRASAGPTRDGRTASEERERAVAREDELAARRRERERQRRLEALQQAVREAELYAERTTAAETEAERALASARAEAEQAAAARATAEDAVEKALRAADDARVREAETARARDQADRGYRRATATAVSASEDLEAARRALEEADE